MQGEFDLPIIEVAFENLSLISWFDRDPGPCQIEFNWPLRRFVRQGRKRHRRRRRFATQGQLIV